MTTLKMRRNKLVSAVSFVGKLAMSRVVRDGKVCDDSCRFVSRLPFEWARKKLVWEEWRDKAETIFMNKSNWAKSFHFHCEISFCSLRNRLSNADCFLFAVSCAERKRKLLCFGSVKMWIRLLANDLVNHWHSNATQLVNFPPRINFPLEQNF